MSEANSNDPQLSYEARIRSLEESTRRQSEAFESAEVNFDARISVLEEFIDYLRNRIFWLQVTIGFLVGCQFSDGSWLLWLIFGMFGVLVAAAVYSSTLHTHFSFYRGWLSRRTVKTKTELTESEN